MRRDSFSFNFQYNGYGLRYIMRYIASGCNPSSLYVEAPVNGVTSSPFFLSFLLSYCVSVSAFANMHAHSILHSTPTACAWFTFHRIGSSWIQKTFACFRNYILTYNIHVKLHYIFFDIVLMCLLVLLLLACLSFATAVYSLALSTSQLKSILRAFYFYDSWRNGSMNIKNGWCTSERRRGAMWGHCGGMWVVSADRVFVTESTSSVKMARCSPHTGPCHCRYYSLLHSAGLRSYVVCVCGVEPLSLSPRRFACQAIKHLCDHLQFNVFSFLRCRRPSFSCFAVAVVFAIALLAFSVDLGEFSDVSRLSLHLYARFLLELLQINAMRNQGEIAQQIYILQYMQCINARTEQAPYTFGTRK